MEKHRICKICNRRFANGKAMGGHMRSHLAKLTVPAKPPVFALYNKSLCSSSSLSIHSSKDHMQPYRSVNNRELSDHLVVVNGDGESEAETESSRNPARRRSKRRRKVAVEIVAPPPAPQPDPESVSSVTESFRDEEVARCLLMLSKDKWPEEDKPVNNKYVKDDNESHDGDDDESFCVSRPVHQSITRSKHKYYKCKTCKKGFQSYQALGGHKASHKKTKIDFKRLDQEGSSTADHVNLSDHHQRIFKCPFCDKVFASGQALGGHKKIHFTYLTAPKLKNSSKSAGDHNLIDLNLPAPEDDSEVSQV